MQKKARKVRRARAAKEKKRGKSEEKKRRGRKNITNLFSFPLPPNWEVLPNSLQLHFPVHLPLALPSLRDKSTMPLPEAEKIPTTLVVGFLGAGKSSLINHILASRPTKADGSTTRCAVVENELGEVGIDSHLGAFFLLRGRREDHDHFMGGRWERKGKQRGRRETRKRRGGN